VAGVREPIRAKLNQSIIRLKAYINGGAEPDFLQLHLSAKNYKQHTPAPALNPLLHQDQYQKHFTHSTNIKSKVKMVTPSTCCGKSGQGCVWYVPFTLSLFLVVHSNISKAPARPNAPADRSLLFNAAATSLPPRTLLPALAAHVVRH
jgi:hypothetical protein